MRKKVKNQSYFLLKDYLSYIFCDAEYWKQKFKLFEHLKSRTTNGQMAPNTSHFASTTPKENKYSHRLCQILSCQIF